MAPFGGFPPETIRFLRRDQRPYKDHLDFWF